MKFAVFFALAALGVCYVDSLKETKWGNTFNRTMGVERVVVNASMYQSQNRTFTFPKVIESFYIAVHILIAVTFLFFSLVQLIAIQNRRRQALRLCSYTKQRDDNSWWNRTTKCDDVYSVTCWPWNQQYILFLFRLVKMPKICVHLLLKIKISII